MIKGKVKIELKDIHTSKTKKIEHDNLVTNAVSKYCSSDGFFRPPAYYSGFTKNNSLAEDFFGGLLLWESQLDSNAESYALPQDNNCIGYASYNISNSGINTHLGSYNVTESGWKDETTYEHVFDFSSQQANGTISALSLTNFAAGLMGLNTPTSLYDESISLDGSSVRFGEVLAFNDSNVNKAPQRIIIPYGTVPVAVKGDILYCLNPDNLMIYTESDTTKFIANNGKKLLIDRYKICINTIGIKDYPGSCVYKDTLELTVSSLNTSKLSTTTNASFYGGCNYSDGYLYVNFIYSDFSAQVVKINLEDNSITLINVPTIRKNTAQDMRAFEFIQYNNTTKKCYQNAKRCSGIFNNTFICIGTETSGSEGSYYIRLDTPAQIEDLMDSEGNYLTEPYSVWDRIAYDPISKICIVTLTDYLYLIDTRSGTMTFSKLNIKRVETGNNEAYFGGLSSRNPNSAEIFINSDNAIYRIWINRSSAVQYGMTQVSSPYILATKNTLDNPVVKTSAQTMKITYSLQQL